jgi:hypothetical protein
MTNSVNPEPMHYPGGLLPEAQIEMAGNPVVPDLSPLAYGDPYIEWNEANAAYDEPEQDPYASDDPWNPTEQGYYD